MLTRLTVYEVIEGDALAAWFCDKPDAERRKTLDAIIRWAQARQQQTSNRGGVKAAPQRKAA